MTVTVDQLRVCRNLMAIADEYKLVPGPAHLMVCYQESGWDDQAFNGADPNGGSRGPYQINGIHAAFAVATDPGFDYGFWAIHTAWERAWSSCGGWQAFTQGPQSFLLCFAPAAQGSVPWSLDEAQAAVGATYEALRALGR